MHSGERKGRKDAIQECGESGTTPERGQVTTGSVVRSSATVVFFFQS